MGGGEVVRYLTRHGANRIARIALVAVTTPFPMKTADNPDAIDRAPDGSGHGRSHRRQARWFADSAAGFFGIGLPGVSVSPEFTQFMIRQCLDCSARAAAAFFLAGFTTDLRADLRAIRGPTLIIHGDRDVQAPLDICGRKTARLVPDNRFTSMRTPPTGCS